MSEDKKISPLKAIREKCIDCSGGSMSEATNCEVEQCPLHPFRKGKNPFRTRTMTPEQKAAARDRLRKAREAQKQQKEDQAEQEECNGSCQL